MTDRAFRIINGKNSILISAPHSTMHKRGNSIRNAETRTGQLVRDVAKKANVYGIYKTKPEFNDANWDKKSKYKDEVIAMVKKHNITALLDIHGMASYREQDICIGINGGKNIKNKKDTLKKMIAIFNDNGFKNVSIDDPFGATNSSCVSTYTAQKCNIIAFQIEINQKYRSAKFKEFSKYNKLEKALTNVCKMLSKI